MRDRFKLAAPFLLASVLVLAALAGCATGQEGEDGGGGGEQQDNRPQSLQLDTVEQWAQSGHAKVVTFAAEEEGCKNCHDGQTYTETGGGFTPRLEGAETTGSAETTGGAQGEEERDWVVGTDCRVCHTTTGADVAKKGSVDGIPSLETAKGGLGALCMSCHNGWHPAGRRDGEFGAPHSSVQTDMFFGVNTMPIGGESTATAGDNTSPHDKVSNTCVGCHMPEKDGQVSHNFVVKDFDGCQRDGCHDKDMTGGGEAAQDYDGDGQTEKYQTEIEGLTEQLKSVLTEKAGGEITSRGGAVVMPGGGEPEPDVYAAAYNYFFVMDDASRGVHNPKFAVKLLTDSITSLGGTVGSQGGTGTQENTTTP